MRAWADAVLVGAGTLRHDDPRLTARDVPVHRQPLRVVVDPILSIERSSALVSTVDEGPVLIVCSDSAAEDKRSEVASWGVEVVVCAAGSSTPPEPRDVARLLAARQVQDVFLEGGPRLAAAWWDADLIDRVLAFVAPVVAGGAGSPGPLPSVGYPHMDAALRLRDVEIIPSGVDISVSGYVRDPY
jgi:diaminohydroxyphosphoribosylaminopyrimidine deaminase/5-amino-6-(5-phosphoribosylamino)uracil reductase